MLAATVHALQFLCSLLVGGIDTVFNWAGATVALAAWACLFGTLTVWLFGKTSNQAALQRTRDKIGANLLAIRLFTADLGLLLRLQAAVIGGIGCYMRYAFIPLLILAIPTIFVLSQLNARYGYSPPEPGNSIVFTAAFSNSLDLELPHLTAPDAVHVEAKVLVPSRQAIAWRLRPLYPGTFELLVQYGEDQVTKLLSVGHSQSLLSGSRQEGWLHQLLYPSEPPLEAPFTLLQTPYAARQYHFLGLSFHWLVGFIVISLVFGWLIKRPLGVTI